MYNNLDLYLYVGGDTGQLIRFENIVNLYEIEWRGGRWFSRKYMNLKGGGKKGSSLSWARV